MSRVCPWYKGYFLLNPLRALWHNPTSILAPYVMEGTTVFEPGPGMGFFTLEIARRVGTSGRVYVSDIQPKMLRVLERRAVRANLQARIEMRLATSSSLNMEDRKGKIDLVFAFAVAHEMLNIGGFFKEMADLLKNRGRMLLVEPRGHVRDETYCEELIAAKRCGLQTVKRPIIIWRSHATLLEKNRE